MKASVRLILVCLISCLGCEQFSFHPYTVDPVDHDLTQKQTQRLSAINKSFEDTLTIALITDSQLALDEMQKAVDHINQDPSIDLVFHCGDFTEYGTTREYEWGVNIIKRLRKPYFVVFGNHDALGTGKRLYKQTFGPLDFTFSVAERKFIFLNTNSWEFPDENVPDIDWLERELENQESSKKAMLISHAGPIHSEFEPSKVGTFHRLLTNPFVQLSAFGHGHSYKYGELYGSGVDYLQVDALSNNNYVKLILTGDSTHITQVFFD